MPELPEVETVKRGLAPYMEGEVIREVQQNRPDLRIPFPPNLKSRLEGQKILSLDRRAKYLLVHLRDQHTLIVHLGMSGSFRIVTHNMADTPSKHDHLILILNSGTKIIFNDPRRFGMVMYHPTHDLENHRTFSKMGIEPLGGVFDAGHLHEKLKTKSGPIKTTLLDQHVVAGLGNIYVCEALYRAGISPITKSSSLSKKRCAALVEEIKTVLQKAIEAGGSSLRDHKQADGTLGYFQHHFSVYGKEGEACPDCHCEISKTHGIKRIVQSGRSTFYCAQKQR